MAKAKRHLVGHMMQVRHNNKIGLCIVVAYIDGNILVRDLDTRLQHTLKDVDGVWRNDYWTLEKLGAR